MNGAEIIELLLRGAAAGLALLLAAAFVRLAQRSQAALFGSLFALGTAAYALVSSPIIFEALGPAAQIIRPLALFNAVLFWWFALSLLCDRFRWSPARLAPAAVMSVFIIGHYGPFPELWREVSLVGWQLLILGLSVHILVIALRDWRDDLVESRRRFRLVISVVIALTVGITAFFEIWVQFRDKPDFLRLLQAFDLFVIAGAIAIWTLATRMQFFPENAQGGLFDANIEAARGVAPEDQALLSRLTQFMQAGGYSETGLTVRSMADRLNTQEHRLRSVINQGLGYRNFAAFLNQYRIEAAKAALSDPAQSRRQILQIALDLGYGSIAPFNRAFREATGQTPTGFRKTALADGVILSDAAEALSAH